MFTKLLFSVILSMVLAEEHPFWTGPIADHIPGQLVQETPEVAAARRQHEAFFAQVRKTLPDLPVEEEHHQEVYHHHHLQQVTPPVFIPHVTPPPAFPLDPTHKPWMGPFADHKLGELVPETPEVAAARKHHVEFYAKVKNALPDIPIEEKFPGQKVEVPQMMIHFQQQQQHHHQQEPQVNVEGLTMAHFMALLQKYGFALTTTQRPFPWAV